MMIPIITTDMPAIGVTATAIFHLCYCCYCSGDYCCKSLPQMVLTPAFEHEREEEDEEEQVEERQ